MKRILMILAAMTLVLTLSFSAFAEDAVTSATVKDAPTATDAMKDAQTAYATAKQTTSLTDYEAELTAMVAAETLTQEQADLLLTSAKEAAAIANGTCPSCGYKYQTTNIRAAGKGMNRRQQTAAASGTEATALEQAQTAYLTAKRSAAMTDLENELKAMVAAETLTQEQADLLLTSAKEAEANANGTCPSCGYQYQTTAAACNGNGCMRNGKGCAQNNAMPNGQTNGNNAMPNGKNNGMGGRNNGMTNGNSQTNGNAQTNANGTGRGGKR